MQGDNNSRQVNGQKVLRPGAVTPNAPTQVQETRRQALRSTRQKQEQRAIKERRQAQQQGRAQDRSHKVKFASDILIRAIEDGKEISIGPEISTKDVQKVLDHALSLSGEGKLVIPNLEANIQTLESVRRERSQTRHIPKQPTAPSKQPTTPEERKQQLQTLKEKIDKDEKIEAIDPEFMGTKEGRELLKYALAPLDLPNTYSNTRILVDAVAALPNAAEIFNAPDEEGMSLVHHAANSFEESHITTMLAAGANPNQRTPTVVAPEGDNIGSQTPLHMAALNQNISLIAALIEKGGEVNALDAQGNAPLHYAVNRGYMWVVLNLINNQADINISDKDGDSPLNIALINDQDSIATALIKRGADVKQRNNKQQTPLHLVREPNLARALLSKGAELEARDDQQCTPLHAAMNQEVAAVLVESGAYVNAIDSEGMTPLHRIVLGIRITMQDNSIGEVELQQYIKDFTATMSYLISKGADVNILDKNGKTAFELLPDSIKQAPELKEVQQLAESVAIKEQQFQTLKAKIDKGERLIEQDLAGLDLRYVGKVPGMEQGATILEYALRQIPKRTNAPNNIHSNTNLLFNAAAKLPDAKQFFEAPIDPNKNSLLHIAASDFFTHDYIENMVKAGANVNIMNAKQETPMHMAAEYGQSTVIEKLYELGANPNTLNQNGMAPIHVCIERYNEVENYAQLRESINVFTKIGVDIDTPMQNGATVLHVASMGGDSAAIRFLVEDKKASVHAITEKGNTALHIAGSVEAAKQLVELGANVNALNDESQTPLHTAAIFMVRELEGQTLEEQAEVVDKYAKVMSSLVASGTNITIRDNQQKTAFDLLPDQLKTDPRFKLVDNSIYKTYEAMQEKISKGEALGIIDASFDSNMAHPDTGRILLEDVLYKVTVSKLAVSKENILSLVEAAAKSTDPKALFNAVRDRGGGNTLMHIAASSTETAEVIDKMIEAGGDPNKLNKDGQTPLHMAAINGAVDVVNKLLDKGVDLYKPDAFGKTPFNYLAEYFADTSIDYAQRRAAFDKVPIEIKNDIKLVDTKPQPALTPVMPSVTAPQATKPISQQTGIARDFEQDRANTLAVAEQILGSKAIEQAMNVIPVTLGIAESRDIMLDLKKKSDISDTDITNAIDGLERARDARAGVVLTPISTTDAEGRTTNVMIRDARAAKDAGPDRLGPEAFEIQYLNSMRALINVLRNDITIPKAKRTAAIKSVQDNIREFSAQKPLEEAHTKGAHQDTIGKIEEGLVGDQIKACQEITGTEDLFNRVNMAKDFQNFQHQQYNIVSITQVKPGVHAVEAEVAMRGMTKEQKAEYQLIYALGVARREIEKLVTESQIPEFVEQVGFSKAEWQEIRAGLLNDKPNKNQVALISDCISAYYEGKRGVDHQAPAWYTAAPVWKQKLVEGVADKLATGQYVIPTQLRWISGLRNAFEKVTVVHRSSPDRTQDQQAFKEVASIKHAGTIANFSDAGKKESQRVTNGNAQQFAEFAGNGPDGQARRPHVNSLNSPNNITDSKDKTLVKRGKKAMRGDDFAKEERKEGEGGSKGGLYTNTAFNALRRFIGANDYKDAEKSLEKRAAYTLYNGIDSKETSLIAEAIAGESHKWKDRGAAKRALAEFKQEFDQSNIGASYPWRKSNVTSIQDLTPADKALRHLLLSSLELREAIEKAKLPSLFDAENKNLLVSEKIAQYNKAIKDYNKAVVALDGENKNKYVLLNEDELLITCASGKDRTGLAMHNASAKAVANETRVGNDNNLPQVEQALLKGSTAIHNAGSATAGGATIGCYGTKKETVAGMPKSRKGVLGFLVEASAAFNNVTTKRYDKVKDKLQGINDTLYPEKREARRFILADTIMESGLKSDNRDNRGNNQELKKQYANSLAAAKKIVKTMGAPKHEDMQEMRKHGEMLEQEKQKEKEAAKQQKTGNKAPEEAKQKPQGIVSISAPDSATGEMVKTDVPVSTLAKLGGMKSQGDAAGEKVGKGKTHQQNQDEKKNQTKGGGVGVNS
ncbi:MAG: ankyrin repeat domain-containing protein [Proteobacteria bacterium]|nr:ankyrin repeat domain-containing protein [Pseudomonadota bacterium]